MTGLECNTGLKHKMATTSEEGEDIWQELREDYRAGVQKPDSWVFTWATGSE
jgi:hypothetical protein